MMNLMTDLFFYSTGLLVILFITTITTYLTIKIYHMWFSNNTKKKTEKQGVWTLTRIKKPIKLLLGLYLFINWALCCYSIGYLIMHMIASL